jgi:3-hydroxymyristoyl/3-hydroxydecanoyl-(acyl carrier protein) dehydratase
MTDAGSSPLLARADLAAPLAWRDGQALSAGQFIAQAQALAERLPAGARPVNLCQDRLHFALGLAAALLRGQTSLLPPNALPATLRQLPEGTGKLCVLCDEPASTAPAAHGWPVRGVSLRPGLADATALPCVAADLEAACLLTSGSTGAPQPHAKRWGTLVANIGAEAARLAQMLGRPSLAGMGLVATVPPQHSYGLESSVLLALLGGASFDAARPFYPADIAAALQRMPHPRALVTTPLHLKALLRAGLALPQVDLLLCATAPLAPQLAAQAEAAMGAALIEIYGCTEAGQVATRRTTAGDAWHTLGELRIQAQGSADAQRFSVSGGHVLEPTPLADMLELHDAQHFRLLGRSGDIIHVAGKRSSLAHLDFHLNRIEGVEDGAFWLPDDQGEELVRPVALVVAPRLSPSQVIQALRQHVEPAFVPRRVFMVAALPREATGKLTAAALRALAQAQMEQMEQMEQMAQMAQLSQSSHAAPVQHEATITVAADHPAFDGHFPGHPVLPGALLLALVLQTLAAQPAWAHALGRTPGIASAKFLAPVRPGARLHLALRAQGRRVAFEVHADDTLAASGLLEAGADGAALPCADT